MKEVHVLYVPVQNDAVEVCVEIFSDFCVFAVVHLQGWFDDAIRSNLAEQLFQMFLSLLEVVLIANSCIVLQGKLLRLGSSCKEVRNVAVVQLARDHFLKLGFVVGVVHPPWD